MFDTAFGRYTAKDWAMVVVWMVAITAMLIFLMQPDDGLGYGVAAVLGTFFAFIRQELIRLRRDVDDLKAQRRRSGSS